MLGLPKKHLALLPRDGSRAMTQDLDMGGKDIVDLGGLTFGDDPSYSDSLWVANLAKSAPKNFRCYTFRSAEWRTPYATAILAANQTNSSYVSFNAWSSAWKECARLGYDGATSALFTIYRAGDITFLDGKKLQWSDIDVYRSQAERLATDTDLMVGGAFNVLIERGQVIYFGDVGLNAWDINLYRDAADVLKTDDAFDAASFKVGGVAGVDGNFTTVDGKTVTVTKGIVTSIV